jgi:hypothetical protein
MGRYALGYCFDGGGVFEYPIWVLERKCYKVIMAMVFIYSYSGASDYFSSYLVRSRMGVDNVPNISRGILFWAIFGRKMASNLEEVYARKRLSILRYSTEPMDNNHISLSKRL